MVPQAHHDRELRTLVLTSISALAIASFSAVAAPPTQITGLSGGLVSVAAASRSSANPQVAVGIEGLGFFVGNTSGADTGTNTTWAAQTCEGCSFARNAVWDDAGQLWVAGSGYGLWKRSTAGSFAKVPLAAANVVQWVARGASDSSGKLWLALGNGVATMSAQGAVTRQGSGSESLHFTQLAVNGTGSKAYGMSGGDVFAMDSNGAWKPLGAPKPPTAIEVIDDVLYVGTADGLYSFSGSAWSALGPANARVTSIAKAASIVIGTANAGMQIYENGAWSALGDAKGNNRRVTAVVVDAAGQVFGGYARGLVAAPLPTAAGKPAPGRVSPAQANTRTTAVNAALGAAQVRAMASTGNDVYVAVPGQGVLARRGKSNNWSTLDSELEEEATHLAAAGDDLIAATESGKIMRYNAPRSSSGSWVEVSRMGFRTRAIAADSTGTIWYSGDSSSAVYWFNTSISKWVRAVKGLEGAGEVRSFATTSAGDLFAGSAHRGVFRWDKPSNTWVSLGAVDLPVVARANRQAGIANITAMVVNGGNLYAATTHGVYRKATNAAVDVAWTSLNKGLLEPEVQALAIDGKNRLIAGTSNGAFTRSLAATTGTESWALIQETKDEMVSRVAAVGNEWIGATVVRPGKLPRVFAVD